MRVWNGCYEATEEERGGLPNAYDVLKEATEPMVLLKLYAHGSHPAVIASKHPDYYPKVCCGGELGEALLIPASEFDKRAVSLPARMVDAMEQAYHRYVGHEVKGLREHLLRLEGMIYQLEERLATRRSETGCGAAAEARGGDQAGEGGEAVGPLQGRDPGEPAGPDAGGD